MGGLRFGVDGDGNYGYYGADDSLIPFRKLPNVVTGRLGKTFTYKPDWKRFNKLYIAYAYSNYFCFLSIDENLTKTGHYCKWGSYPVNVTKGSDGILTFTGESGRAGSPEVFSVVPYNV